MAFDIFPWGPMKRKTGTRDVRQNLMDMKDCGFTASRFIEPKDIPACREVGLNPITFLFDTPDSFEVPENQWEFNMSTEGLPNITRLVQDKTATPEIIEKAMEQALSQVPEGPARVYIVDEPGASWMPRSNQMVEYVRKHRPELTPYINLFPNYAVCGAPDLSQLETDTFEEYLDAFCRIVPGMPISIDNYIVLASKEFRTPGGETIFYQNYIQVREACDKYGVEFHHIICSNQLRNYQPIPTFNNLLLQAMTSLAAGARSIAWYTYFGRAGYLWAPVDDNTDDGSAKAHWYRNGGRVTHLHWKCIRKTLRREILDYLHSLPLRYALEVNGKNYLLVHAATAEGFDGDLPYLNPTHYAVWKRLEAGQWDGEETLVFGIPSTKATAPPAAAGIISKVLVNVPV